MIQAEHLLLRNERLAFFTLLVLIIADYFLRTLEQPSTYPEGYACHHLGPMYLLEGFSLHGLFPNKTPLK